MTARLDEARARLGDAPAPLWFRAVARAVAALPFTWLASLGALIGLLAGSVLRIRRAQVEAAMARADIHPPSRVARAMYASLGRGLVELLWVAGRGTAPLDARFFMDEGAERAIREGLARGRGLVVATAHTGNWDFIACASASWLAERRLSPSLTVVTKRLSWQALDRAWQRLRRERGVTLVPPQGASAVVHAALGQGEVVALLVDQAPPPLARAVKASFLGADARCDLAPALLAARAGAPVVALFGHRREDGMHVLSCRGTASPEELATQRGRAEATIRIAHALERFVVRHPAQWLWLHRRWKGAEQTARDRRASDGVVALAQAPRG